MAKTYHVLVQRLSRRDSAGSDWRDSETPVLSLGFRWGVVSGLVGKVLFSVGSVVVSIGSMIFN